jgi:hypothetical protein
VQELKVNAARQETPMIAQQQKQMRSAYCGLEKLSAQLGASKPLPRVVNNPMIRRTPPRLWGNLQSFLGVTQ